MRYRKLYLLMRDLSFRRRMVGLTVGDQVDKVFWGTEVLILGGGIELEQFVVGEARMIAGHPQWCSCSD